MVDVPRIAICATGLLGVILLNANNIVSPDDVESAEPDEMYDAVARGHTQPFSFANVLYCGCVFFFLFVLTLMFNQRSLMYRPIVRSLPRVGTALPEHFGLKHQDLFITSADGTKLHAWLLYKDEMQHEPMPAIIFFHSNAGDISQRLDFFRGLCHNLKVVVLALEYRGFGRSEDGNGWCEEAFIHDAFAAYEWLVSFASLDGSTIDRYRLFIFGRSIGGAVSMRLVAHLLGADPSTTTPANMACSKPRLPLPAGVILENTFSSFAEVASHILPPLRLLPRCILARPIIRDEWRSVEWLAWIGQQLALDVYKDAQIKMCFLSAGKDRVVSPKCMDILCNTAEVSKSWQKVVFHRFPRSGHMDTWRTGGATYWSSLQKFLAMKDE